MLGRIEALSGLAQHWEDFDKRIHTFENLLVRLDERQRNVDQLVRSRRHLEDTKNVIQVSEHIYNDNIMHVNCMDIFVLISYFIHLNIFVVYFVHRNSNKKSKSSNRHIRKLYHYRNRLHRSSATSISHRPRPFRPNLIS